MYKVLDPDLFNNFTLKNIKERTEKVKQNKTKEKHYCDIVKLTANYNAIKKKICQAAQEGESHILVDKEHMVGYEENLDKIATLGFNIKKKRKVYIISW